MPIAITHESAAESDQWHVVVFSLFLSIAGHRTGLALLCSAFLATTPKSSTNSTGSIIDSDSRCHSSAPLPSTTPHFLVAFSPLPYHCYWLLVNCSLHVGCYRLSSIFAAASSTTWAERFAAVCAWYFWPYSWLLWLPDHRTHSCISRLGRTFRRSASFVRL